MNAVEPSAEPSASWDAPYDTFSKKWNYYPRDVIPMWVADMDMPHAQVIIEAVMRRITENRIGYPGQGGKHLAETLVARLSERHGLHGLPAENAVFMSCVPGLHATARALTAPGDAIVVQTPLYGPFLDAISTARLQRQDNPLVPGPNGYEIDFDHLETVITPATKVLMVCNPHNPTGRVWRRAELERLADVVLRHRLWLVSDELHNELVFDGPYIPFASLSTELAMRTITLTGPAKTFNTAGLSTGITISHSAALISRVRAITHGLVSGCPNVLSEAAWLAAIATPEGDAWHQSTLADLRANRDQLTAFLHDHAPRVAYHPSEGTYLAWLDVRAYDWGKEKPGDFLLEHARVGLSDGLGYSPTGAGHVRLNFATTRPVLDEALNRLKPFLA